MLTCFLLDKKLDNGDYLFKKRLCLRGSLKKIFKQLEMITYEMISKLSIKKILKLKITIIIGKRVLSIEG